VPSGNFGNVCAGHVARMMGLPIARLVVATNENDVLDEFFRTGRYRVRGSAETWETSSPSMDISKASNFERFVFDLLGRDGARTRELFGATLARDGEFTLSPGGSRAHPGLRLRLGIEHARRPPRDDPRHVRSLRHDDRHAHGRRPEGRAEHRREGEPMIVLETALPAKFAATIVEALGRAPELPAALADLESRPRRFTVVKADAGVVQAFIERHAPTH
jgi:threonine synthase